MPKRIDKLTQVQRTRMKSWADEWVAIGLSTERADWDRFEKAIRACYKFAGLRNDVPIIRVSSPIVGAFAAPIAANVLEKLLKEKKGSAVYSAVDSAVRSAVDSAVYSAVDSAVRSAVYSAVDSAVRKDQRLETLPLCAMKRNKAGNDELRIISGHHRTRAARAAGVMEVYVLVIDGDVSDDAIRSRQLSHNAIDGQDDPGKVKEIYDLIQSVEEKIASAVDTMDFGIKLEPFKVENISLPVDYEILNLVFLPHQRKDFEDVVRLLSVADGKDIMVAERAMFDNFKKQIRRVSRAEDIRNISTVVSKMCEIVKKHLDTKEAAAKAAEKAAPKPVEAASAHKKK